VALTRSTAAGYEHGSEREPNNPKKLVNSPQIAPFMEKVAPSRYGVLKVYTFLTPLTITEGSPPAACSPLRAHWSQPVRSFIHHLWPNEDGPKAVS
jgi:hypothetical protein